MERGGETRDGGGETRNGGGETRNAETDGRHSNENKNRDLSRNVENSRDVSRDVENNVNNVIPQSRSANSNFSKQLGLMAWTGQMGFGGVL